MKLFLLLLFSVSLAACRSNADIRRELAAAEAHLQEAPDSALHILERIDPASIRGKARQRASKFFCQTGALFQQVAKAQVRFSGPD